MKIKHLIAFIVITIGGAFWACGGDKDLEKLNPNQLTVDNFYQTDKDLISAVNSVYALLQGSSLVGREWFFTQDLRSDEMASGGGQLETPRNQLLIGVHTPNNALLNQVWEGNYRAILRTNSIVAKIPEAKDASADIKKRVEAEARFLRGYCYYDLLTLFGGVPLYTKVATKTTETQARATEADVLNFIIEDLKAAANALPDSYSGSDVGRATKGAALAFLAKALMFKGDYAGAKAELQKVITSTKYGLMDDYQDNFREEKEFNKESLFEIGFAKIGDFNWASDGNDPSWGNQETQVRTQEYSAIGWRNVIPSDKLLDEFERPTKGDTKEDPRLRYSFYFIGDKFNGGKDTLLESKVQGNLSKFDGKDQKISWQKYSVMYKDNGTYATSAINHRILRYAEVLLMMAECENEAGTASEAIKMMNLVRSRKGVEMPTYPTTRFKCSNKDEIFAALMHEKMVEHAGEQIRNRDILRWRKQNKLKTEPISYFQKNKHELLPIPQAEIDNNDKIDQKDQNPGY
jgi:starch-binding outer membrane protein, SusD/RagB family